MRIIKGQELKTFIENCEFRLDPFLKQLGNKRYPPNSGKLMLQLTHNSDEMWLLEKEIEKKHIFKKKKYFEFEGFGPYNESQKIHIPVKEFIEILQYFSSNYEQFHISMLADTIGLKNNKIVKGSFDEFRRLSQKKMGLSGLKPKDFYDKEFGSKSTKERELSREANQATDDLGTEHGSYDAMESYSKIIKINPKNAFAWFNKGLAILDFWRYDKTSYMFDTRSQEEKEKEIQEKEKERKHEAEECFQKAIDLHPYLQEDYEKLQKKGRIY
ncbi:hypothetical protein DLK05_05770 [Ancylomarina longa]|uniref:Tetratricopeptide repeat protein n=2 Tax=Ancylomarina longa TaxID=2487017 RepID=A0A434AX56_9BACT|nr:hypothetical protein DLK05_05770 [Ancylomarina longa]